VKPARSGCFRQSAFAQSLLDVHVAPTAPPPPGVVIVAAPSRPTSLGIQHTGIPAPLSLQTC